MAELAPAIGVMTLARRGRASIAARRASPRQYRARKLPSKISLQTATFKVSLQQDQPSTRPALPTKHL
jgi:hypothetical protein